jgi:uncharacterized protein (TIGR02453 family)
MFPAELFAFLQDLKANNRREWFTENKARYEDTVRQPLSRFVEAFAEPLEAISPHCLCDKGSIFRIHRDTRFSPDKTPYKTHAAAQFRHERGKDVHAPGFYLHLEPGEVFVGGGLWRPDSASLSKVRSYMVAWPDRWRQAKSGGALGGDSLSRSPRGFAPDHPLVEDLKRKDFVMMVSFSEKEACRADFLERCGQACGRVGPLIQFLCQALDFAY